MELYKNHEKKNEIVNSCLDLGCGTGLSGEVLRPFCMRLVGLDLSRKMLDKARDKAIYDRLIQGDIMKLEAVGEPFDLIVAADIFPYIGDLAPLFNAISSLTLRSGARILFSIEIGPDEISYKVDQYGRFQHSDNYIRKQIAAQNLRLLDHQLCELRLQEERMVKGGLYLASK